MSAITTHVLDTSRGRPASGVPVVLEIRAPGGDWKVIGRGETDDDGRLNGLLPADMPLEDATYRLTFDTGAYFSSQNIENFYPLVTIVFNVSARGEHYHVPLLVNPYGYSTYRGS